MMSSVCIFLQKSNCCCLILSLKRCLWVSRWQGNLKSFWGQCWVVHTDISTKTLVCISFSFLAMTKGSFFTSCISILSFYQCVLLFLPVLLIFSGVVPVMGAAATFLTNKKLSPIFLSFYQLHCCEFFTSKGHNNVFFPYGQLSRTYYVPQ